MIDKMLFSSGHTMSFKTLGQSIFGLGSDNSSQVYSMDEFDIHLEHELESFEYRVFSEFQNLLQSPDDEFLSLIWLSKLLNAFCTCQQDFKVMLSKHAEDFSKPPLDKLLKEFYDRSIKALDICNAVCDGIDTIKHSHKQVEIVTNTFNLKQRKQITKSQFRRASKALNNITNILRHDREDSKWLFLRGLKSFGHSNKGKDLNQRFNKTLSRSSSLSVSTSWSASKQLQSMANGLTPPRQYEITATRGLARAVFTMGFVHMIVSWVLVAVIPCQGRSVDTSISIPKNFLWGDPFLELHGRIMEESKKRDRKNSVGLLLEIHQMETCVGFMRGLIESNNEFPLSEDEKEKVKVGVDDLNRVSNELEDWLFQFERDVRHMFHKIASCRNMGLDILRGT